MKVINDGWNENPYTAYTLSDDQTQAVYNYFHVDAYKDLNADQRAYLAQNADWLAFASAVVGDDSATQIQLFPYYTFDFKHYLYIVDVSGDVYAKARTILQQVMDGTVGNEPIINGRTYQFELTANYYTHDPTITAPSNSSHYSGTDGTIYTLIIPPRPGWVQAPSSVTLTFEDTGSYNYSEGYDLFGLISPGPGGATAGRGVFFEVLALPKDKYQIVDMQDTASGSPYQTGTSREFYVEYGVNFYHYTSTRAISTMDDSLNVAGRMTQIVGTGYKGQGYPANTIGTTNRPYGYFGEAPIQIPTTPDPQPDPPIQPPDPGTDVPTVDPPTWPTIDFPDITIHGAPITITWPTIADNADYTQLLKEIIKRLEKIGDLCGDIINDLDEHCQHLQQAIQDAAEYIVDNLELGIDPDLDDLIRGIDNAWRKITQTIKEQVKWLADQLDYDFDVTLNLDEVTSLLRKILAKMGGGTSKPDPTLDPFSWGDWLDDLWKKIFTALQIALPDELGELLELFDILKTKFPFSVPFDLIAIVALFDHAPVTPVFDLPYPMLLATGVGYDTVTIDCSGWNSTMVMVRDLEVVLFTAYLISRTQWAMDAINPKKGK